MSWAMWTHTALASEVRKAAGEAWRVVEHQYTVSTRKLVDTSQEQLILEDILEETKPPYPSGTKSLHYLLKTPFRYPPSPWGSRFRRAGSGFGVFYCAEELRTSLAEFSYWRRHFILASLGTPLPRAQESLTAFQVAYRTDREIDLMAPPLVADRKHWTHPTDYSATQSLADEARLAGIDVIRYESVRDPEHGACLALLDPSAFADPDPVEQETWYLYLGEHESSCTRAGQRSTSYVFRVEGPPVP